MNLGMYLDGSRALRYTTVSDVAAGGSIGSADIYNVIGVNQTTASKVLTIATPADGNPRAVVIANIGSAGFWMYGRFIRPGGSHEFVYVPSVGWRRTSSGDQVIAHSAAALTAPADTSENALVSLTIPGGVIGANGAVITHEKWSYTNSANAKTFRVRYGSTLMYAFGATTTTAFIKSTFITNRNSESSQIGDSNVAAFGTTTQTFYTGTVDTSADFTLNITGQKASGGESLILESYSITVRRSD